MTIVIRPADMTDVPTLPAIEMAAGERFRTVGLAAVADGPPLSTETLLDALEHGLLWVALVDARPVGFLAALPMDDGLHIEEVSVLPTAGGRGVGSALLDTVIAEARRRGRARVSLSTFRDVPWNAPFYGRRGFVPLPADRRGPALRAEAERDARRGLAGPARVVMHRPTTVHDPSGDG